MLDWYIREQLFKMLNWYIGLNTEYIKNPGKYGKYYDHLLEHEKWLLLLKTYADAEYEHTWDALLVMDDLFRMVATTVAENYGFQYPWTDDHNVTAHLKHVRGLPREAEEMY